MLEKILQPLCNKFLHLDQETKAQILRYNGKVLSITLKDLNQTMFVLIGANMLHLTKEHDEAADVSISATSITFVKAILNGGNLAGIPGGTLQISGDAQLAQNLMKVFGNMDVDIEDQLAQIIGDFPARKLGLLAKGFKEWSTGARESVLRNTGEYLVEESREVASRIEVQKFITDVDDVRATTDRLAARIDKLIKMRNGYQHNQ